MKSAILSLFVALNCQITFAQQQDSLITDISYNKESGKVSISRVTTFADLTADQIYSRVMDWYNLKLNTIKNIETTKRKDVSGDAQLISIFYFNFDPNNNDNLNKNRQKLIFKTLLNQSKHGIALAKWMSGMEQANLIILIKEGKVKIEFTDFFHIVTGDNSAYSSGLAGRGLAYEDPKTAVSKKNWNLLRLESLNKHNKLITEVINYIKNPSNTNFDF